MAVTPVLASCKLESIVRRQSVPITCLTLLFLFSLIFTATPTTARASVSIGVSVYFGPPAIPVYEQPPDLWPNYVWSPGYWAWDDGYYWVPGTWVPAPEYGLYWTPGYWAYRHGYYSWSQGYWATQVGFYGGLNYGYGYYGNGYVGGSWQGNQFRHNTAEGPEVVHHRLIDQDVSIGQVQNAFFASRLP